MPGKNIGMLPRRRTKPPQYGERVHPPEVIGREKDADRETVPFPDHSRFRSDKTPAMKIRNIMLRRRPVDRQQVYNVTCRRQGQAFLQLSV